METAASAIEQAIERILKRGVRTAELPGTARPTSTTRMGDLVAETTQKILKSAVSKKR
jgi:isocitrate/isopropylmalate dehydrogenase